ncbi:MAG: hypothetical protein JNJ41_08820 [Bacteroidia bacterium]|nr:hypothetical protein [Bacteroidia bacterium]
MKIKLNIVFFTLLLSLLSVTAVFGQKTKHKTKSFAVTNKEKDNRGRTTRSKSGAIKRKGADKFWIIGIGGNVVDDDGSPFKKLFNVLPRWNVRPYPTRLTVERSLNQSFSVEGAFNFNTYKPVKIINNEVGRAGIFLSMDVNMKNDLNSDGWINPYVIYGVGGTFRTVRVLPIGGNLNIGFGFNIWFTRSFGINFQSIAKFGVSTRFPRSSSNYLQHSTGLVFKIQKGGKNPFIKPRYKWIHRNNIGRERT